MRSMGRGNILLQSWIVCGALYSRVVVCIICVEDSDQERVEGFGGWRCGVWFILEHVDSGVRGKGFGSEDSGWNGVSHSV